MAEKPFQNSLVLQRNVTLKAAVPGAGTNLAL